MGQRITSLEALLVLLYELAVTPPEPWAFDAIRRGLAHSNPVLRELAIGAAHATPDLAQDLLHYAAQEQVAWLARYAQWAAETRV